MLVVEHDEQMMRAADWLVDMGPGAGEHGGYVVAEDRRARSSAMPSRSPASSCPARAKSQSRSGAPRISGRSGSAEPHNNLKGIDVEFPVGKLVCVTGVSGSGKSTLVNEIVFKALANRLNRLRVKPGEHLGCEGIECFDKAIDIDQSPIGRTPRSIRRPTRSSSTTSVSCTR